MSLSDKYRQLAALIEALESHDITVQQALPVAVDERELPADEFVVRLEVSLPEDGTVPPFTRSPGLESEGRPNRTEVAEQDESTDAADAPAEAADASGGSASATSADIDSRDAESAAFEPTPADTGVPPESPSEATSDSQASTADGPESTQPVVCTAPDCDRTFETERGMKIHRTKAHPLDETVDDSGDEATHYDPEALKRVYREHETFAEMTAALDVDVGAQAVRKQMIRHGVHVPGGGDSKPAPNEEAEAETETGTDVDSVPPENTPDGSNEEFDSVPDESEAVEDGDESEAVEDGDESETVDILPPLDLPQDLTAAELKAAVEAANTLYDVQRALDIDHDTTHDILCRYDLLDLVTGRASTAREREEQKAELHDRLQRAAT